MQTPFHLEALTQIQFYSFFNAQTLLHTEAFAHRRLGTHTHKTVFHKKSIAQNNVTSVSGSLKLAIEYSFVVEFSLSCAFFMTCSFLFVATMDFHVDFHWGFQVASWHVSCSLAMLALLLRQNDLANAAALFTKEAV